MLELIPVSFRDASNFVNENHRHHIAPQGHKYSIGITDGEKLVGVVIVGRPVARRRDDGFTLEVTRCCVIEGIKDGCSKLYGAAWRVARNLGYKKLITYTLEQEKGVSLIASGWKVIGETTGKSWSVPSRPRVDKHPLGKKTVWAVENE